jgi:hypothetical protein
VCAGFFLGFVPLPSNRPPYNLFHGPKVLRTQATYSLSLLYAVPTPPQVQLSEEEVHTKNFKSLDCTINTIQPGLAALPPTLPERCSVPNSCLYSNPAYFSTINKTIHICTPLQDFISISNIVSTYVGIYR